MGKTLSSVPLLIAAGSKPKIHPTQRVESKAKDIIFDRKPTYVLAHAHAHAHAHAQAHAVALHYLCGCSTCPKAFHVKTCLLVHTSKGSQPEPLNLRQPLGRNSSISLILRQFLHRCAATVVDPTFSSRSTHECRVNIIDSW